MYLLFCFRLRVFTFAGLIVFCIMMFCIMMFGFTAQPLLARLLAPFILLT
jgi:hypothetical protein